MSSVKASNLAVGYSTKPSSKKIVSPINFELFQGSLVALVGSNGVGKSTLLKTLSGQLAPLSGEITYHGVRVQELSPHQLSQQLSVVLTEKLPNYALTVYEMVALGRLPYSNWLGQLRDEDHHFVHEALLLTETLALKKQYIGELSDGQLQKVLIARAIAQDTPYILLDEPSTHLDLQHKAQLFQLLKKLSVTLNKCVLFSTHDLDVALQMSDQLMVLTPDAFYFDTPDALIEKKVFQHFFSDKHIIFDAQQRTFSIQLLNN